MKNATRHTPIEVKTSLAQCALRTIREKPVKTPKVHPTRPKIYPTGANPNVIKKQNRPPHTADIV